MKLLSFDPAGKKFGIAGIEFNSMTSDSAPGVVDQSLRLYLHHLIEAPISKDFDGSKRTQYMAHVAACVVSLDQPDIIVSEKPWGMGFSKDSLLQLIGALKAELWRNIEWQGVSEARRAVLGDSWGGSTKQATAEWLLNYPWDISSKRFIKSQIDSANPSTDDGYDILDAILHGICYLVKSHGLIPVHKPKKERKRKARGVDSQEQKE